MITINGKYTHADIMTDIVEPDVIKQVNFLCNHPLFKGKKIVLQSDVHPAKATCVGLSCEIDTQHIIPQLLGTDIYCTISAWEIKGKQNDWKKLDKVIKGLNIKPPKMIVDRVTALCNLYKLNPRDYLGQFGTLGGGNHFCSVEEGQNGKYLIIHSGSRNLGKDIAIYYFDLAYKQNPYAHTGELKQLSWLDSDDSIIYQNTLNELMIWVNYSQTYLAEAICKEMKWKIQDEIICPHNYIDLENKILHKGSIKMSPARLGIIPINMADGSLIVRGYTAARHDLYNYSAPHGAGRLIARSECNNLNMKEYKKRMKNVYSSCVNVNTIDESPMAYKPIEQIKESIEPICEIVDELKPVYNYKEC